MTSLLGRLLRLFPESVPLEDLFTEAVARLFEIRPQLCLEWLEEAELISPRAVGQVQEHVRVSSQRTFAALENHDTDSRPDLLIEVFRSSGEEPAEEEPGGDVVMVESKIGSGEGPQQLRRYAEHLEKMQDFDSKTLLYITRSYDPKEQDEILSGFDEDVIFKQLRWHDFYRFLTTVEKDTLLEEVMIFMEEQGMARSYRFSTTDLMALSGVPRAYEIFDETLGGEVKAELEKFAGNKVRRETHGLGHLRAHKRYLDIASLHEWDLFSFVGYQLDRSEAASIMQMMRDGYPGVFVVLESRPNAVGRETSVAAMKRIAPNDDWESYNLDNPSGWAGVRRYRSLATLLSEEDHVAAVQRFFVESIHHLRAELTEFKKEHPDLLWSGE